ncbi:MAG: long-chain fatty acid--CoA ligase [Actinobacteria bacterium]|nr:long-chain fatty acid--CoA ligase [Actinomycetota bacterium]
MYLTQGLHRSVQQTPGATMSICGERVKTFREVADRVARLAGALQGLGVGRGDRVAILSLNSDRYHEALLAVPWADAVVNPVNIRWSAPEIVYALDDSESAVLFVDDAFAPMVPTLREGSRSLTTVIHCGEGPTPDGMLAFEKLVDGSLPVEDVRRGGDELAGLFYTGGTTGFPKGVMLSHANLQTSTMGVVAADILTPSGIYLHAAPMFHLADLACWCGHLALGGTHVFIPMFDPVAVMTAVESCRVTDTILVPTMLQMLVDHPELPAHDMSSLSRMLYGASPISESLLDRVMKALPWTALTQGYGMTELAPLATYLPPADHSGPRLRSAGKAASITELRIVDPDDNEVSRGTVGEICVRGGQVMQGYWRKPEETEAALRGGWMHTGDAAYMDDEGYIFIVDRVKDMIVSGGENVYSAEVENAVAQHPAVAMCAVIGVPDDEWGERVHAVVVLKPGVTATAEEIRGHAKTLIAGYKAPRSVEFTHALPISGAGKVLKRELRQKYWSDSDRNVS